jgi:hypothetical protein
VLHSADLLALVSDGFQLEPDAAVRARLCDKRASHIKAIRFLHEHARSLLDHDADQARTVVNTALENLGPVTDCESAVLLAELTGTKAKTYPPEERTAIYEQCLQVFTRGLDGINLSPQALEMFIKTQFALACAYNADGNREKATQTFALVYSSVRDFFAGEIIDRADQSDPLWYLLAAKNQIALHHLHAREFTELAEVLEDLLADLEAISDDLAFRWTYHDLVELFGPDNGTSISQQLFHAFSNFCCALICTAQRTKATEIYKQLVHRFRNMQDAKVHTQISTIGRALQASK